MPKGKASGPDREYQKLAHDIVQQLRHERRLIPFKDDGVDIAFDIAGTRVTFDAVLKSPDDKLVVIECKRFKHRHIEQRDLFAFWGEVEWLRRTLGVQVESIFITKFKFRKGALSAAPALGISIAICEQDQSAGKFVIAFQRLNADLTRSQDFVPHNSSSIGHSATVEAQVNRKP